MSTVRLDEDDLDEEDRAILAEISKKGYYHGRPKSEACAPPAKIETPQPVQISMNNHAAKPSRAAYDEFQAKWDRFDNDDYLEQVETSLAGTSRPAASRAPPRPAASPLFAPPRPVREFKILLVGDSGCGKTALVRRHITGEFDKQWVRTLDLQVHALTFSTDCGDIQFNVWDLSFSERHYQEGCIRESHLVEGQGAIIMFDRTSRLSYRNAPNWHREVSRGCGAIPTVLVGNKVDVPYLPVKAKQVVFHQKRRLQYYDVSAQTRFNVEKPFLWLARRLANRPELQFVGPFAHAPQARLEPAVCKRDAADFVRAQAVAADVDDCGL